MFAPVGKHKGKSAELLILKEPSYVHWLLKENPTGPLLALQQEVQRLIKKLDQKPFQVECYGRHCTSLATRISVYGNAIAPLFWCDRCDPYQLGANSGKLQIFRSYSDALSHVEHFCGGRQIDYKDLIKALTQAKGLPPRVGEPQAVAFF